MISRDVPDVSPARVGALLEDDILKQLFDRKEINLQQVKAIEFKLGSDSQLLWEQLNIESQQTDWLLQLVRTNQYVSFNWSLTQSDATVTIGLDNAQLNKRLAVNDIRGAGAVRLEVPDVSFSDIAGHHAVKEQLTHVVELLRAPEKIAQFGGTVSKGMLLYGPPGTGKTMLAKALAHEANLPVMSLVATEFADVEMIRETFARARRYAPSILFIDEIDAVGSRQKDGHPGLINTLLAEIDGFDTGLHSPVFVIAATNLPENIDPALLRSGRIDLHIEVPDLDRDARAYFIDKILALPLSEPVDRQTLLDLSIGMTGADLSRALSQLAARLTVNQDNGLTEDAIVSLIHQYRFGKVRSVKRSQQVRTLVAYHEAGHAVVSALLNPANKVSIINIIAREHRAGFVAFNTEPGYEQQRRVTYTECIEDIAVLLAGRLAEAHYAPGLEPCAGASDDLAKATQLAEYAISELGLDAQLGIISLQGLPDYYRPAFTAQVVERIESWMTEAQKLCDRVLTENWELVERVATVLLAQEVISGRQFYELIEG
jgi:ATP-dependent Zn protease